MSEQREIAEPVYFDGNCPVGQPADLSVRDGTLTITLAEGPKVVWPVSEVRRVGDHAGPPGFVLRVTGDPVARLYGTDKALLTQFPQLTKSAPPKGRAKLAAWAIAAVAAVAVQIFVLIPLLANNLAGFIPPEGERALGHATLGQIRSALDETGTNPLKVCENPDGVAALERLVMKLGGEQDFRQSISVSVLDHEMINAFALPGGFVVLFRGLIEAAEDPDEVTAVLAHEIGHVISRDPTRNALRSAGSIGVLGLLFGDFAGGAAVLFLAERLISAQYSQAAEAAADSFAHDVLLAAKVRPGSLGDMFSRIREKHGDRNGIASHFLSHPSLEDRIEAAHQATPDDVVFSPSMPSEDWAALRKICSR